jgi:hypothetical protein
MDMLDGLERGGAVDVEGGFECRRRVRFRPGMGATLGPSGAMIIAVTKRLGGGEMATHGEPDGA